MKPSKVNSTALAALLDNPNASPDTVHAKISMANNDAYQLTEKGLAAMFNVNAGKISIVTAYRNMKPVRDKFVSNIYTLRPTDSPPYAVVIKTDDATLRQMQATCPDRILATSKKGPLGLLLRV